MQERSGREKTKRSQVPVGKGGGARPRVGIGQKTVDIASGPAIEARRRRGFFFGGGTKWGVKSGVALKINKNNADMWLFGKL